jgi:hypothetical protein
MEVIEIEGIEYKGGGFEGYMKDVRKICSDNNFPVLEELDYFKFKSFIVDLE